VAFNQATQYLGEKPQATSQTPKHTTTQANNTMIGTESILMGITTVLYRILLEGRIEH
jgi:hypothetical protein